MLVVSKMKVCAILCLSLLRFTVHAGIARRDTTPDGYYVYSSRKGCASVNSTEPCPVTWKIPTAFSISYRTKAAVVLSAILPALDKLGASNVCKESVRKTYCSQITPRCLDEGRLLDFGDVNSTCQKIHDSCPKHIKQQKLCDDLVSGEHQRSKCVEVSKPIKGGCPQPKYKMTSPFLWFYEKQSKILNATLQSLEMLKYSNGTRFFSSVCLPELKKLACSAFYCSADEKYLLTAHNTTECSNWIKECFSGSYPAMYEEAFTKFKTKCEEACKTFGGAPYPIPSAASNHLPQFLLLIVSLFLKVFI